MDANKTTVHVGVTGLLCLKPNEINMLMKECCINNREILGSERLQRKRTK